MASRKPDANGLGTSHFEASSSLAEGSLPSHERPRNHGCVVSQRAEEDISVDTGAGDLLQLDPDDPRLQPFIEAIACAIVEDVVASRSRKGVPVR
jgi:hypothetical protein